MDRRKSSQMYRVQLFCSRDGSVTDVVIRHAESGRDALRLALKSLTEGRPEYSCCYWPLWVAPLSSLQGVDRASVVPDTNVQSLK